MLAPAELPLLDDTDLPWIRSIVDVAERSAGQPWRVLLERLEYAPVRAHRGRVSSVVSALRRVLGGAAERAKLARKARALVLGHPALDRDTRDARLAAAAAAMHLTPTEIEDVLWADLAKERRVMMPAGRPSEATLAALANLERIQRAVRRARSLRLRAWDDAHDLVARVARYGLLAEASLGSDGETVLDVTGPLALFHATTVYGRALAGLVPLLADQRCFTLDVHCDFGSVERILHVEPPVLLPPAPVGRRRANDVHERLARELATAGYLVDRRPAPIRAGGKLLFAHVVAERDRRRWWIEIVGFSTAAYLARKLAAYRDAGIDDVVLCIDAVRSPDEVPSDRRCLRYYRSVDLAELERVMR